MIMTMKLASGNTKLIYMYSILKAEEWVTMKQIVDTLTNLITDAKLIILYSNIHII